eukprot:2464219-Amphidinium_carterae.1
MVVSPPVFTSKLVLPRIVSESKIATLGLGTGGLLHAKDEWDNKDKSCKSWLFSFARHPVGL